MRLDARKGDADWHVFHVPTCKPIKMVVWVDDEIHQYAAWPADPSLRRLCALMGEPMAAQAERVRIVPARRLVLIDPVDDAATDEVLRLAGKPELEPCAHG